MFQSWLGTVACVTDALHLPTDNWSDWLRERVAAALEQARHDIAAIKDGTSRETAAVLELWNDADIALGNAGALAGVLAQVHPDEDVRKLAEDSAQDVTGCRPNAASTARSTRYWRRAIRSGRQRPTGCARRSFATSGAAVSTK